MSGFVSALIKQRRDAKKAGPDTSGRAKEIVSIIRKYDYDDGITPEIVVGIIQDLGPTFVKIGQIASQQSDQIPRDYCDALAGLRSSVAPMDIECVHAQIEKHLGKPVEELFASFDDKPLGSASIGQVHRAELTDGTVVAVKVRRPGVVDTVARDFALIEKILDQFVKGGTLGGFDIRGFITELERTSKTELDFTNEAVNLERFRELNDGRERIDSPKCYRNLTNEAILTEDFAAGTEAGNATFLGTLDDAERDLIAALVADNFATQVLTDGFYHADPHSGNVLIKEPVPAPENDEAKTGDEPDADDKPRLPEHGIEWIDFGMMGTLTTRQRQTLIDLVTNIVMHDAYGLKRTVLKVATPKGEIDHGALLEMCEGMCDQYTGDDFGDFSLGDLLDAILTGLQDEEYKIDPFLTNLSRGIIAVEGTVKTLSPRVNILNHFMDKVNIGLNLDLGSLDLESLDLDGTLGTVLKEFGGKGGGDLTKKAVEVLDMLEKGQITIHSGFGFEDGSRRQISRMVGNCVMGAMSIALFIGSCALCLMPHEDVTRVQGIPVIGFVGYLLGILFMYLTIRRILKDE